MSASVTVPKMETIGVLGGMGPQATMDFEARIHRVAQQLVPQFVNRGYPQMVVVYHREPPMELAEDGSVKEPLIPHPKLLELAKSMGPLVDFIVIPCHTAHFFVRELEEASGRKVLSIVDVTIQEVQRRGFSRVGILAVGETLKHRLYQDRLDELRIFWEIIPDSLISTLDEAIYKVMEGGHPAVLCDPMLAAFEDLKKRGTVEAMILGCTELPLAPLPLAIMQEFFHDLVLINPSQLLAEAAVRYALEP